MDEAVHVESPAGPRLDMGIALKMLEGESASGDTYVVQPHPHGVVVAVIDALGHGAEAASPANLASNIVGRYAKDPLLMLVQRCHEALVGTRGVVMSLASFDYTERTMTWMGVGDVSGVLMFSDPTLHPSRTGLVNRAGVLGSRLPQARPWVIPINEGDTLVFATDGVRSGFEEAVSLVTPAQELADQILARYNKGTDDALVLVARFMSGGARV
jgi:serine phosphatase RsbU (regulator of sigma subunit)